MTNFQIIQNIDYLSKFLRKNLPQKISYCISKNLKLLSNEYEIYYNLLEKIKQKYGVSEVEELTKDERANQEINELLGINVNINLYTINENLFNYNEKDGNYDTLTPAELIQLQSILCKPKKSSNKTA